MNERELLRCFKALADEKRLQIMKLLQERSTCVCQVMAYMEMTQPTVSHHLKILKDAGLVKGSRQGKWIFYALEERAVQDFLGACSELFDGKELKTLPSVKCEQVKSEANVK